MQTEIVMSDGTVYQRVAWTGGDIYPKNFTSLHFRELIRFFFHEQVDDYSDYWKECPNDAEVILFWNRAKADAWRTLDKGKLTERL